MEELKYIIPIALGLFVVWLAWDTFRVSKRAKKSTEAIRERLDRMGVPRPTTKPRYQVYGENGQRFLSTDSRLRAWLLWRLARSSGAVVYDREVWVDDPASWVRAGPGPAK